MNNTRVVKHATINTLVDSEDPSIIVLFPNYEDRSKGLVRQLYKECQNEQVLSKFTFILFCLKGRSGNNMLLEDLKEQNLASIKRLLEPVKKKVHEHWLEYPSDSIANEIRTHIQRQLDKLDAKNNKINILYDISSIPKSVIFQICESIKDYIQKEVVARVVFAYCLPEKYSKVPYAQDIGQIKGLFSGKALSFPNDHAIQTLIFPSRSGHEGKLLCDTIDSISQKTDYTVFFPIYQDNFAESLSVMQANQSLIDSEAYLNCYYCTLDDAIKAVDELFQNEYARIQYNISMVEDEEIGENTSQIMPQVYLVAPFGPKIFLPLAYFELLKLQSINPDIINIEIANVKGFQYTSSYSLGGDGGDDGTAKCNITCFELENKEIQNALTKDKNM